MKLRQPAIAPRKEIELTGLINVVFLILIFFIVAGSLRPFSARDIELSKVASDAGNTAAPGHIIAHVDGQLTYHGAPVSLDALVETIGSTVASDTKRAFIVVADARLDARALMAITRKLKLAGHQTVAVMSERVHKP